MNKVLLIGNIGRVDEHTTQYGKIVALSLATEENKKVNDKWEKKVTWHRVIVKGKAADQPFKKGDSIFCDGKVDVREYEKDGAKKQSYEIHCNFVKIFARMEKKEAEYNNDDIGF